MSAQDTDFVSPRLALVGANSLLGKEIKDQLAAAAFPGTDVALFDLEEVAGLLTEYGQEARVVAEAVAEQVLDHELVCFCGDRETAIDYLPQVRAAGRRGLDVTGAWLDDSDVFAWIPGVSEPPTGSDNQEIAIPPAAALLLGSTVAALGDLGAGASANVFVPASELGDAGLRELSQQSTAVMNLLDVDNEVFGRQMAFDLWTQPTDAPHGADKLTAMLKRLGINAPATHVVATPVFHGMALSMFVPGAAASEVSAALANAAFNLSEDATPIIDSPLTVVGAAEIHAINVRDDGEGSWVWAVADNLHARAAAAVAAILAMAGSPLSDALQ